MATKKLTFEDKMRQLDEMVTKLNDGSLTLDETIAAYEKAVVLAKECSGILDGYEASISKLTAVKEAAEDEEE